MKSLGNIEGLNSNNKFEIKEELDVSNKENFEKWDLDEPILEQIENLESNKGLKEIPDNIELEFDWDLDEPILEQIKSFDNSIENFKIEENGYEDENLEDFKKEIQERTGWSDEIIEAISSVKEGTHYESLDLKEEEINGKNCLVKERLDTESIVDPQSRTNKERMEQGLSPIDENGEKIELHHIGQKSDAPLVELNTSEHRGKKNYSILHENMNESEINRNEFNKEKVSHWKTRVK